VYKQIHVFLILAQAGGEWSASRPIYDLFSTYVSKHC